MGVIWKYRLTYSVPHIVTKESSLTILPCAVCGAKINVSSQYKGSLQHVFCSPFCKVKDLTKNKDPALCWVYSRPCFSWGNRTYSIRMIAYEIHHSEALYSRKLISLCKEKLCANPHHLKKKEPIKRDKTEEIDE
jgi:hypothetical protein